MPSNLLQLLDVKHIYKTKLAHFQYLELLSIMCKAIENASDGEQINNAGVHDAIREAVYKGNVEFIIKITNANPELVWTPRLARSLFMLAIELRQAEVLSLIHGVPDIQVIACSIDPDTKNNMLHRAASIPSSKILDLIPGGAALQMQRELQWFKEVGSIVTPAQHILTNKNLLRPQQLFTENHKDLVIAGEKWMKDTSGSCSVVGALIVTITFAAAFTVPGGNDQNIGFPIFRNKKLFKVFFISDAISLFSSTTSVLMFLGILTSRYAEEDFLKSLPTKMIIGLSTLFFSIATMMIAFCAAVSVMLPETWIALLVCLLASVPIASFVRMQFHLLVDILMSTYGPSIFKRNIKPWLDG
ncbi:ankyrin repeat-containing protein NPR4-like [Morus notabilis]|uniref:ankyrin repeat-containing protein NPR4-like n=1 Tax=Morus notabilis TaxID=981085 RepID=UPI000CED12F7|nr:ankyrin repeat-containing protein NPR4-like [Morus notabilis]